MSTGGKETDSQPGIEMTPKQRAEIIDACGTHFTDLVRRGRSLGQETSGGFGNYFSANESGGYEIKSVMRRFTPDTLLQYMHGVLAHMVKQENSPGNSTFSMIEHGSIRQFSDIERYITVLYDQVEPTAITSPLSYSLNLKLSARPSNPGGVAVTVAVGKDNLVRYAQTDGLFYTPQYDKGELSGMTVNNISVRDPDLILHYGENGLLQQVTGRHTFCHQTYRRHDISLQPEIDMYGYNDVVNEQIQSRHILHMYDVRRDRMRELQTLLAINNAILSQEQDLEPQLQQLASDGSIHFDYDQVSYLLESHRI
jgi:hypothetical protein